MGEPMTERRFNDILVQRYLPEDEILELMMHREPTFVLAQIQTPPVSIQAVPEHSSQQ